ncbi:MAG: hypothetical protein H6825_10575 [Planctomycetes bacterium]|nr:hypothetical protein [Planctomycetota bacterium]
MTEDEPRQQTFQLVALAEVDARRGEVQKLIDAVPRILAARKKESRDAESILKAQREKLQGFRTHLKSLELDLAEREAALSKANGNLLTAKSNAEYSLLMAEITRKKEEKGKTEESILEQFEVIKQGERLVVEAEQRLVEAQSEYVEFEQRALRELDSHHADLAKHDERREQIRRAIHGDVLKIYDRAYVALGTGIVPAEGRTCQGCFSLLTPNDANRLLAARNLVVCKMCSRILYDPQVLQASSP